MDQTTAAKPEEKKEAPPKDMFWLKVYSPFRAYFDDIAKSITAVNDTGPFDILARHKNFMTLLNACDLRIVTQRGTEQVIRISRGIMHVKADEVTVFLDV